MSTPDDDTIKMPAPPLSSPKGMFPQETLLQRGAFDPPATPGTIGRLDRFEILRLIGEGGMGQVYLAREPVTDTLVAVKIMQPQLADDPQIVHRFLTEARHMYRLSHPRILRVLEVSDRKEGPYYVMPYIDGGNLLKQYTPDHPMSVEQILSIAIQVAEALAHAHAHGLIHRDLKPGNVLLDKNGYAYLTDFGLVRTVYNDSESDSADGHFNGTAHYLSPAVASGQAEDTRCDIYAFGALLYEMLVGDPPYSGRSVQIILSQILQGPPAPIRSRNPKANPALTKIAEGCMARELRDRYASMSDVISDLNRATKGQIPFGPHQQQSRLPHIAALLIGTLTITALGGFAVHYYSSSTSSRPRQTSDQNPATRIHAQVPAPAEINSIPFTFTTNNGSITISKYTGTASDVTIPNTMNGIPVTVIGKEAFINCTSLISVTIPNSVTQISFRAFYKCSGLANITIPKSINIIEDGAFADCTGLTNVTIPDTVTYVGAGAFQGCINLIIVSIPNSVDCIKDWAFASCHSLAKITLGNSITNIKTCAFIYCSNLVSITIPSSLKHIEYGAFWGCTRLTSVYFMGDAPVNNSDSSIFSGDNKFSRAHNLTVYHLPSTKGWGPTFGGRPTAVWNGEVPRVVETEANQSMSYTFTTNNGSITSTKYIGPGGKVDLPNIINSLPVTRIGDRAFSCCTTLTRVSIPDSVITLEANALRNCGNLTELYFKGNAPNLGGDVFKSTTKATIYYLAHTTGWGQEFGGRPTSGWKEDVR